MTNQKTIMIVDDDKNLRDILTTGLENSGYHVVTAHNGQEGLKRFDETHPNLIILDLHMPIMDGREFYSQMRERLKETPCPIIGLTGEVQIEDLFEGFNIDAYLTKPFEIEKLLKMISLMIMEEK